MACVLFFVISDLDEGFDWVYWLLEQSHTCMERGNSDESVKERGERREVYHGTSSPFPSTMFLEVSVFS